MNLAIDPDLFTAADCDNTCGVVLERILEAIREDKKYEYRFALDGNELEREYLDFYQARQKTNDSEHPAFLLMDYIFKNLKIRTITLPSEPPENIRILIDQYDCKTPVEPQLIGMAHHSKFFGGLNMLLPGPSASQKSKMLRKRGLNNRETRKKFTAEMEGIAINDTDEIIKVELTLQKTIAPQFKIFLSYARPDEAKARDLYDGLAAAGYTTWFDKKSLLPGQNWEYEIEKNISQTDIVIVLLSTRANNKHGFYQKEVRLAVNKAQTTPENEICLIPAMLDNCEIPDSFSKIHCASFAVDWETGFNQLLDAIKFQHRRKISLYNESQSQHLVF